MLSVPQLWVLKFLFPKRKILLPEKLKQNITELMNYQLQPGLQHFRVLMLRNQEAKSTYSLSRDVGPWIYTIGYVKAMCWHTGDPLGCFLVLIFIVNEKKSKDDLIKSLGS